MGAPNTCVEALSAEVTIFESGALEEVAKVKQIRALIPWVSVLKGETLECLFLLSHFIHTARRGYGSTQKGGGAHKLREEA